MLTSRAITSQVIEALSKNLAIRKSRKVLNGIVRHPKAPRHVSLPLSRHLFTFELLQVALSPAVPADVKIVVEGTLIAKLKTISMGERLTLAKQGSTNIAATLLLDEEPKVVESALNNSRLNETAVEKILLQDRDSTVLPALVAQHPKWSLRKPIQFALLKNPNTPFAKVLEYAAQASSTKLKDAISHSPLSPNIQAYLERLLESRRRKEELAMTKNRRV